MGGGVTWFDGQRGWELFPRLHEFTAHLQVVGEVDARGQTTWIQDDTMLVITSWVHDAEVGGEVHVGIAASNVSVQEEWTQVQRFGETQDRLLQFIQSADVLISMITNKVILKTFGTYLIEDRYPYDSKITILHFRTMFYRTNRIENRMNR